MRIRMFSLCSERDLAQRKLEAKITDALHGFASNEIEFEDFSAPQEMLEPLAQSLKNEPLTVVAVERPSYNKIKKKLLAAMGYTLTENENIRQLVSKKEGLDEKKITSHSLFPENAKVFTSADGLFSAFSVQKGSQLFMMLPLDNNRIDGLLNDGVIPYLVGLFGEPVNESAPAVKKEKESFADPLVRSVNLLKEANSRVAFCANKQEPIIDFVIKSIEGSDDLFVFAPHVEDRGDIDVVSYSVQLARAAKTLSHTELGAVISDPFDDENGRGVCISITDGEKAIARRFYAEENESDESLVRAATEEAISLLGQNAYGVLSENAIGPESEYHEKIAGKKTVKTILIILLIILVLCIGAGVVFKYLDSNRKNEPTTTSATQPTSEITTTKKAEPVEEKDLMAHVVDLIRSDEKRSVPKSNEAPEKFIRNGSEIDAKDALALILQKAIDDEDDWNDEALKAMAVVIYTNLKYRDNGFDISDVTIANTADAKVKQAVDEVYGEYLSYDGEVIAAPYHRYSAGKTAAANTIYGVDLDYLVPVEVESDKRTDDYEYEIIISTASLNSAVLKATAQNLFEYSLNPEEWMKIVSHDSAFDGDTGYVEKIEVASEQLSGYDFVKMLDGNVERNITSLCFDISYKDSAKEFTFTCHGYGSGVGLSQRGAIKMAKRDSADYEDILTYFYTGAQLEHINDADNESTTSADKTTTAATSSTSTTAAPTTTTAAPTTTSGNGWDSNDNGNTDNNSNDDWF